MREDRIVGANGRPGCRVCGAPLELDLGMSPLCRASSGQTRSGRWSPSYPLYVFACERCYLVQLEAFVPPDDIFTEYAYFSTYSTSWVEHARQYVEMIRARLGLDANDLVVELASNDGYLLPALRDGVASPVVFERDEVSSVAGSPPLPRRARRLHRARRARCS